MSVTDGGGVGQTNGTLKLMLGREWVGLRINPGFQKLDLWHQFP
jgi:hypothetical protein